MNLNEKLSLSSAGEKRRADMRGQLQAAFARHHRVRKLKKTVAATGVACGVIATISFLLWSGSANDPNPHLAMPSQFPRSKQDTAEFRHVSVEYISDQQLLDMLDDIGQPSILAKVDGKAMAIPCRQRIQN